MESGDFLEMYGKMFSASDETQEQPMLRVLKAMLPSADERYKRQLGFMIRFMELQALYEAFKNTVSRMQEESGDWRLAMLDEMKHYVDPQRRRQMELFMGIMSLNNESGGAHEYR